MIHKSWEIGKAIRPLFTESVTYASFFNSKFQVFHFRAHCIGTYLFLLILCLLTIQNEDFINRVNISSSMNIGWRKTLSLAFTFQFCKIYPLPPSHPRIMPILIHRLLPIIGRACLYSFLIPQCQIPKCVRLFLIISSIAKNLLAFGPHIFALGGLFPQTFYTETSIISSLG